MNRAYCIVSSLVVVLLAWGGARADVALPSVFASGMVLQRDRAVPVWGTADPSEQVVVEVAGQIQQTLADPSGRWKLSLNPMRAGGPVQMLVRGRSSRQVLDDVLVGEVWICSGQSNMDWPLQKSATAQQAIATADLPTLRLFKLDRVAADLPLSDCKATGWQKSSPSSSPAFSGVGYFFARHLHDELGVPVGIIQTSWGGTRIEAWTDRAVFESDPDVSPVLQVERDLRSRAPTDKVRFEADLKQWQVAATLAEAQGKPLPRKPVQPASLQERNYPGRLYSGMVAPLAPYGIRGVIWYQGEANVSRAWPYRLLLPAMIRNWRAAWGDESLPFGIVQLAGYGPVQTGPGEASPRAELRETQRLTAMGVPHTGLTVAIDVGQPDDIHPTRKQEVGDRLALWALATVYGRDLVFSGPMYKSMQIEGDKVRLTFDHATGLRPDGDGELQGFEVAGEERTFHRAKAEIIGDAVVVSSTEVPAPVAVRYGWANSPVCNLENAADLPASPFRTDDWPVTTQDKWQ